MLDANLYCGESGAKIGFFRRRFFPEGDGLWHADHKEFFITHKDFKGIGIGRAFFRKAIQLYVPNKVKKVSLEAVQDGRFVWMHYGFKPEKPELRKLYGTFRTVYRQRTHSELPESLALPRNGPPLLYFRYRGVRVGALAMERTQEIVLTLDLKNPLVRLGFVGRGWIPPWYVFA
jgi:hypothetical protein